MGSTREAGFHVTSSADERGDSDPVMGPPVSRLVIRLVVLSSATGEQIVRPTVLPTDSTEAALDC